jgi:hypothetical protein
VLLKPLNVPLFSFELLAQCKDTLIAHHSSSTATLPSFCTVWGLSRLAMHKRELPSCAFKACRIERASDAVL